MKKLLISVILLSAFFLLPGCDNNATNKVNTVGTSEVEQINEDESVSEHLTEKNASATLSENEIEISDELADSNEEVSIETENEGENVEESNAPSYSELVIGEVVVGGTVFFGRYEQDNNLDNGPEAIEWVVTSVEDDFATLLPVTALMCGDSEDASTLPQELYNNGFTEHEKELISEFHNVIDIDFISRYVERYGVEEWYYQSPYFTCMLQWSDYATAKYYAEYVLSSGNQPDGSLQVSYRFIIEDSEYLEGHWVDVTGGGRYGKQDLHIIDILRIIDDPWGTINPYIVIRTER